MKRILTTMCALTLILAAAVPALAVEPEQSASYYPTSVEEYMEGDSPRIKKVYQLSLADDPSQILTEDFERDGRLYYLLDMTRKDEVGVDIQTITQTKTLASETNDMEQILQSLEPQMEVTTEDGYTGTLTLDHTTVKVAADGYATRTKDLSATRTYPNLSEADLSLIPKSIEDNGKSLTLADVQWAETSEAGADGAVTRYTATAKYTGTTSSTYATGYKEAMVGDTVDLGFVGSNTRRGRVCRDIAHTLEASCIQGIVERGGRIRRLMPRESLRLQGFAEEQIDKILAITSDAQAYKQAGNSVTVTVIEAIGRRIRALDEELKETAA